MTSAEKHNLLKIIKQGNCSTIRCCNCHFYVPKCPFDILNDTKINYILVDSAQNVLHKYREEKLKRILK